MKIERTISIDGRTVTITHKVDTGVNVTSKTTAASQDNKEFAVINQAASTFTAPPATSAAQSATSESAKPKDVGGEGVLTDTGGEGVLTDTGGGASGGTTIVFGAVIVNCPGCKTCSRPGGEGMLTDPGGSEGVPTDPGGGESAVIDTGGGEGALTDTGGRRRRP